MAAETELRLKAELTGGPQTAAELQKVAEAQKEVAAQVQAGGKAAEEATPAVEALNASTEDFRRVLNQLVPNLGRWANGLDSALRVAGDLAGKNVTLTGVFDAVTAAVTRYGGALKLLGAAGFAIAGFTFFVNKLTEAKQKAEEASDALEKLRKAQTNLERGEMGSVREIVEARDKDRRLQPFSFEQQKSIRDTLRSAPAELRDDLGPILTEFGGAAGFGTGGGAFASHELGALARLGFKPDESASARTNERRARRLLDRERDDIKAIRERQAIETDANRRAAASEALSPESLEGAGNLAAMAEEVAGRTGTDAEFIAGKAGEELTMRSDLRVRGVLPDVIDNVARAKREGLTAPQSSAVDELVRKLDAVVTGLENATDALQSAKPTIDARQYNPKNFGPDAASKTAREVNGKSELRKAEGW